MSILRRGLCVLATALACFSGVKPAMAVVSGVEVPCTDRRFDAVGAFLYAHINSTCGGGPSGTCTLIAPNMIITARHCLGMGANAPVPDLTQHTFRARFRRGVNGVAANSLSVNGDPCHGNYTEAKVIQIIDAPIPNNADQVICILERNITGIRPIGIELDNPPRESQEIILAGWGFDGGCLASGTGNTLKMAKGIMPANYANNDYLVFSPCALASVSPCLSLCPILNMPFVLGNLYDSGAPILIEVPSADSHTPQKQLRLVGTVSSPTAARRPSAFNNAWGTRPAPVRLKQAVGSKNVIADFNIDHVVNIDDVMGFIDAFMAGTCTANLDAVDNDSRPPSIDGLFKFLNAFFDATRESSLGGIPIMMPTPPIDTDIPDDGIVTDNGDNP